MKNKILQTIKREEVQNILFLMVVLSFIVAGFIENHYLSIVAFLIFCGGGIFLSNKLLIYDLFFLMSFGVIFKYNSNAMSLFTLCEIYLVVLLLLRGEKFSITLLVAMVTYLGYLLLGSLFCGQWAIKETIKQIMNIALLFLIGRIVSKDLKIVALYFIGGVLCASLLGLFANRIPDFYEFVRHVGYNLEITDRFTGLNGDPNYYVINVVLSMGLAILLYQKKEILSIVFWIIFLSLSFFGLQTYSKSFILMFALVLFVLLIVVLRQKRIVDFLVLGGLGIVLILMYFQKDSVVSLTIKRLLSSDDLSGLTTNRSDLWRTYIDFISKRIKVLFVGVGIGAGYLECGGPHNFYIELIYYLGIIGCLVLFCNIFLCFREGFKSKKAPISYMGILLLLMMYFFLQMLFAYDWIFQICLAYLMLISTPPQKKETRSRKTEGKW